MENKIFTTEGGKQVCVIEVPQDAIGCVIKFDRVCFDETDLNSGMLMPDYVMLPPGKWQGKLFEEMTEEECEPLVEKVNWGTNSYLNYTVKKQFVGLKPRISLASRLRSLGFKAYEQKLFIAVKKES